MLGKEQFHPAQHITQPEPVTSQDLAMLVHELRTPLISIMGYNHQALLTEDPAERAECSRRIDVAGKHLMDLVSDVLSLSRLDAGKCDLRHVAVDTKRLVLDCLGFAAPMAAAKDIPVNVELTRGYADRMMGDPQKIRQVLVNLLANAIKFTESGSIALKAARRGNFVYLSVHDTGPGMTQDQIDRLFRPFQQFGAAIGQRNSTGLGLAISRALARAMGGDLSVTSKIGVGSVFTLCLPFVPATGRKPKLVRRADAETERVNLTPAPAKEQFLVVEDNDLMRDLIGMMLAQKGHSVLTASSGLEALKIVRTQKVDVVLMDHHMTGMDGIETARAMRAIPGKGHDLVIVGLTANVDAEDKATALKSGMDAYMSKSASPADIARLLTRIQNLRSTKTAA